MIPIVSLKDRILPKLGLETIEFVCQPGGILSDAVSMHNMCHGQWMEDIVRVRTCFGFFAPYCVEEW